MARESLPPFSLFAPPYRDFLPIDLSDAFPEDPKILWGTALVWNMDGGRAEEDVLGRVAGRPAGVSLMVILPPAERLAVVRDRVLAMTEEARPQTVLPFHPRPAPEDMAHLLRREPSHLPEDVTDFLLWRGVPLDQETRWIVRRTVELAAELRTLGALARGVYLSRRALGRRFQRLGLPVPSHWLQFSRLLRATVRLQNSRASLLEVALSLGYPDGFTLSNQMDRLVGVRPTEARERLGWEWFVEAWLQHEWAKGGLKIRLPRMPDHYEQRDRRPKGAGAGEPPRAPEDAKDPADETGDHEASGGPSAGGGRAERSEAA
jgi:AraC-like DNA-binding protein